MSIVHERVSDSFIDLLGTKLMTLFMSESLNYLLNWFIQIYNIQQRNKSVIEYFMQLIYSGTKRKISIRHFLIHNNYLIFNKMFSIKLTWKMVLLQQILFCVNEAYLNE